MSERIPVGVNVVIPTREPLLLSVSVLVETLKERTGDISFLLGELLDRYASNVVNLRIALDP